MLIHNNLLIDSRIALGVFDFDGNILATDTVTYLIDRETGKEVGITAHELDQHPEWISGENSKFRWHDDFTRSVRMFRDFSTDPEHIGPDEIKKDVQKALEKGQFSPSIYQFVDTFLVKARLFAIITARGHSQDNMARILWHISESILTEDQKEEQESYIRSLAQAMGLKIGSREEALRFYFDTVIGSYPVSNTHVAKNLGILHVKSMSERKVEAMKHYIQDITHRILTPIGMHEAPRAIGFSDDSVGNMKAMFAYFQGEKVAGRLGNDKVRLYFTGKKEDYKEFQNLGITTTAEKDMLILKL